MENDVDFVDVVSLDPSNFKIDIAKYRFSVPGELRIRLFDFPRCPSAIVEATERRNEETGVPPLSVFLFPLLSFSFITAENGNF